MRNSSFPLSLANQQARGVREVHARVTWKIKRERNMTWTCVEGKNIKLGDTRTHIRPCPQFNNFEKIEFHVEVIMEELFEN